MLLGQIVLQTLHLPLLAIFQHPLLIPSPPWPKGNSFSSAAAIDRPLRLVVTRIHMSHHVMSCMGTATNTYANAKAINTAMMDQAWRMRWLMGYFDYTITREIDIRCVVAQRLYRPHILGIQADYRYEYCFWPSQQEIGQLTPGDCPRLEGMEHTCVAFHVMEQCQRFCCRF